jgi:Ca2+-binding RTX toxin-like protein
MVDFTWGKGTEAFVWDQWWTFEDFGASFGDPDSTSTEVVFYDPVQDVRITIGGTGFNPTGSGVTPSDGVINTFEVTEQGNAAVTVTGMNMTVLQFGIFVAMENINGFLTAVFAGADTLTGNARNDTLHGLGGGDTVIGGGGADTLLGDAGNDTLLGGVGADNLNGGAGNDYLWGGTRGDTLTGGGGRDNFVLNVKGAVHRDNITDFSHALDTIRLDGDAFDALGANGVLGASKFYIGAAAHDANDRIIYNANTGQLYYDANGNGAGQSMLIAKLDAHLNIQSNDFVVFLSP